MEHHLLMPVVSLPSHALHAEGIGKVRTIVISSYTPGITPLTTPRDDKNGFFLEPVTDEVAPGYSSIIQEPMDIRSMRENVSVLWGSDRALGLTGEVLQVINWRYYDPGLFVRHFDLVARNAITFNAPTDK